MIDWERVNDLKQTIGVKAVGEVVTLFLEESDAVITRLAAATSATDLKSELHALKGNALNLGFTDLAQICQIYEARAETGDTDVPLAQIQSVYERSRTEFLLKLASMIA